MVKTLQPCRSPVNSGRGYTRSVIRIGCSGWNYRDWRGAFYPDGLPARRWLEAYAEHFDTVEVNTTFYRLPARTAVARWVEGTPDGFGFAVKVSRYLTHIRRLRDVADGMARLGERIEPLVEADRLLATLWQLPANFHRDDERLAAALDEMPPGRHAFEPRHPSWFAEDVAEVLRERDVAFVVADDARADLPEAPVTASWHYVRLHYGHRGRRGNYGPSELDAWARRIRALRGDVLAYFNNDWEAFAPRNAEGVLSRLRG
jgi:uncharacterized protein YecE (DUF72 family)